MPQYYPKHKLFSKIRASKNCKKRCYTYLQMILFDEDKQQKKIQDLEKDEQEELAQIVASRFGLPYINFANTPVNSDALRLVEESKARAAKVVLYDKIDKKLELAVQTPKNEAAQAVIRELEERGYKVALAVVSQNSLDHAWEAYKDLSFASETKAGSLEVSNEEISQLLKTVKSVEDIKKLIMDVLGQSKGYRISKIFEIILAGALATGASDIHIEPEEEFVRLRFRLDGVLNQVLTFDNETYHLLLSRVKLLSGMKLNVKKDSQDGRFSVKINETEIQIRSSVLPGAYSESIVMRILNPKSIAVSLEELGIDPKLLEVINKVIARPEGMLLTTGPTGSGKTTTLYALLKKVYSPEIKVITIEDPIEYHLSGIVQTQTDAEKGYTFLQGLRAALRQDPDVIMVGEIRDAETAEIAIESALTGHFVFSTLHTNNAAGTFPRLIDLKVNSKIIASAVTLAMAQRLIRKLCKQCKKEVKLEGELRAHLKKIVESIADKSYTYQLDKIWEPLGCPACNNTGYKGRIGVYEAIQMDSRIEDIIIQNPSEREIVAAALPQGLLTLQQDAILKILSGETSIEEVERVIDMDENQVSTITP
jgi:type IV pilus assembly protein PilB